ncbi:hypothetical protein CTAYLR_004884 [Chrysophaeum taylorii]|uniref:Uncharacterized protein n=1 Tax=Chrysophaeum taylorii TaxID=2483200 RepID=A0AAD7UGP2_9STRA|nr:hypothetical protein CTAYLR_004884 [Chrysophaeum taylorii]
MGSFVLVLVVCCCGGIDIPRRLVTSHKTELELLPEPLRQNIDTWRSLNSEWEFAYFDDAAQLEFMKRHCDVPRCLEAYELLVSGAARADVFRIAYMLYEGGFWFDSDVKPGRLQAQCDLDGAGDVRLFLVREPKHGHVRYMVIGGHAHPLLRANLYRQIANVLAAKNKAVAAGALVVTGPFTLGKTLCDPFAFASPSRLSNYSIEEEAADIGTHCTRGFFSGVDPGQPVLVPGEHHSWAHTYGTSHLRFRYDVCFGYWHRPGARGLAYQKVLASMNVTHHTHLPARR